MAGENVRRQLLSSTNEKEIIMKLTRHAEVLWQGGTKTGGGAITTESGALRQHPYGYGSRFADQNGTNPEELVAAAHAACFTMYLSYLLDGAGLVATRLETKAAVTLQIGADGSFDITTVALTLSAAVPGVTPDQFGDLVARAKAGCAVSKLLTAQVNVHATLISD